MGGGRCCLGAALGPTAATTSAIVDRLERAGYAQRNRNESDRRLVTIEPTPLAWRRIVEIMRPLMGATDAWVKALAPEDARPPSPPRRRRGPGVLSEPEYPYGCCVVRGVPAG